MVVHFDTPDRDSVNTELVAFDLYSALMDTVGSLAPLIAAEFQLSRAIATDFVMLWRSIQMQRAASSNAMGLGHVSFVQCTEMGFDYALQQFDLQCDAGRRRRFVEAWSLLNPFPEANEIVDALNEANIAVAILSNGDQAMLSSTTTRFSARFDYVLSAQTAGKFKPHPDAYALPETILGIPRSRVLYVAGSSWDVLGSVAFGMPCVWSNRNLEALIDEQFPPLRTDSDLTGVLKYLYSVSSSK